MAHDDAVVHDEWCWIGCAHDWPPEGVQESHIYTVDAYVHGVEDRPCVICGKGRRAHERYMAKLHEAVEGGFRG